MTRQSDRPDHRRLPDRIRRALHLRRESGAPPGDDVDVEIRFHLETRIEELTAEGHDPAQARRVATEEFGDIDTARRALSRVDEKRERSTRRVEWLGGLRRDVAYGWRKLRSSPGFAAAAVLTLALGIGATTAIFSAVHAVLLRPLPFPEPDRLVKVWETSPEGLTTNVVSSGNYLDWREETGSFAELGAHSWLFGMTLTRDDGEPVRLGVTRFTPSALAALAPAPVLGRLPSAAEGEPGAEPVAVIGHRLWRDHLGGDPGVVGRPIRLDGQPYTVVGVMPPSFDYPDPKVDVWRAMAFDAEDAEKRESHQWNVVGRLAAGVPLAQAQAELDALAERLERAYPEAMTGWGVNVVPLRDSLVGEVRTLLWVLMGVVGVVLLLTCVNLANLLLARATAREREIAVRGALGAGRRRLVRQLLVESLLLGVLGGGLALAVIAFGLDALVALAPPDIPLLDGVRIDPVVLGFAGATTLLATLLFGLIPALRATSSSPSDTLRGSRGSAGGARRLRAGLLAGEVALAVVLVVGAGLLLRSMARLNAVDPGLDPENVLMVPIDVSNPRYRQSAGQVDQFFRTLLDQVRAMPGVVDAAGTTEPPLLGYAMTFSYQIEGRPARTPSGREDDERLMAITPDFFRTLDIPILAGRPIDDTDRTGTDPVAVISRTLADKQWPEGDALGSRIRFREGMPWIEIVGIVDDARIDGLDQDAAPFLYIAFAQKPWNWMSWLALTIRTEGDPTALTPVLRRALLELDPTIIPETVTTLEEQFAESTARRRFATQLLGAFAALALVLGALGIYGLLAYSVAQRRQEIGIRMALGAEPSRVARGVVGDALRIAAIGAVIGAGAALGLTRVLTSLLYQVEPTDPAVFGASVAMLMALAAGAAWLPARSATKVEAAEVLSE